MELSILNTKGQDTGKKIKLAKDIFGVEPNDYAIYLAVRQYMANNRTGAHKAKERAEIKGSTRKLRKQKGSGYARVGSIKNPIFRGGGRAFGPRPRDYGFKLNKKLKQTARKSAISYKVKDNKLVILEDFNFEAPKTKLYLEMLNNLNLVESKTLLVLSNANDNIYLSQRNVWETEVVTTSDLTTYDILNADYVVMVESAVKKLEEGNSSKKSAKVKPEKKSEQKEVKAADKNSDEGKPEEKAKEEKVTQDAEIKEKKTPKSKKEKKAAEEVGA